MANIVNGKRIDDPTSDEVELVVSEIALGKNKGERLKEGEYTDKEIREAGYIIKDDGTKILKAESTKDIERGI